MNKILNENSEHLSQKPFDIKKLLQELATDIAKEHKIQIETASKLIQNTTLENIFDLKRELSVEIENSKFSPEKLEKLLYTIQWAKEIIAKQTSLSIEKFRENIHIDQFQNDIENYLPANLLKTAKNAKKPHEHILWVALWTANSLMKTAQFCYEVGRDLIKTPFHLYLITSGKAELQSGSEKKI